MEIQDAEENSVTLEVRVYEFLYRALADCFNECLGSGVYHCRLLTVMDQGETLEVRFGPIPLFRKTVQYADIVSVELVGQYYSTAGEFA